MRVVFWHSDKEREIVLAEAFLAGVRNAGDEGVSRPIKRDVEVDHDCDVAVMVGVKSRELFRAHARVGVQVIALDKGYARHKHVGGIAWEYWRVSVGSHQPTQMLSTPRPSDRWEKLGLRVAPWRKNGNHILFAGSSAKYHEFYGIQDPSRYAFKRIREMREFTNREVVYRPKPSWHDAVPVSGSVFNTKGTINDALLGAHALVTHGSNACFEAMLLGVPSIILGDGVAKPISSTKLEDIRSPRLAKNKERLALLSSLAYFQWTLAEMASGEAWEFLRPMVPEPPGLVYKTVCRTLGLGHGHGFDGPSDTLNRLFRKTCGDGVPKLTEDNVAISLERLHATDVLSLAQPTEGKQPRVADVPVVIVRYLGTDYLIDGSKRIWSWSMRGRKKIRAYVLTVL